MGTWSRCCAAAAAAGGEFLQFCENVHKRCWGGRVVRGAGDGEGGTTDVTHWAWGAALGSFTQQLDFVDTVYN